MRLWHHLLIPYLPNLQLISQWRELNSIYARQNRHILINYVYEYPLSHLYNYSLLIMEEMKKRGIKVRSYQKFNDYFKEKNFKDIAEIYQFHHNDEYLRICCWNLYEKMIRGQNFTGGNILYIKEIIDK